MDFLDPQEKFFQEINQPDHDINLAKAALYFAQIEGYEFDIAQYLNALDVMAETIKGRIQQSFYPLKIIKTINQHLYHELNYQGDTGNYYDPRNSFLNQVIDRRLGIPITLSLVYLEVARRLEFPMIGIGMPGHFLIRPEFEDVGIFVDAFNGGEIIFEQDCQEKLQEIFQQQMPLEPKLLAPVTKKQFLARILTNLKYIYINNRILPKALNIIDLILLMFPNHPRELRDRGLIYYDLGNPHKACQDLELYLEIHPHGEDEKMIRSLISKIRSF